MKSNLSAAKDKRLPCKLITAGILILTQQSTLHIQLDKSVKLILLYKDVQQH